VTSLILDLAKRRRTVRTFSSTPVDLDLEDIFAALEAACQAPSGANSQPWRFIIITDPQIKMRIRKVCEHVEKQFYSAMKGELKEWLLSRGLSWRKPFLEDAPILVLVLSQTKAPYSSESVWLAIGYILLALEELGLGTVTYTPPNPEVVADELNVPNGFSLEAILPIGISADEKPKEPRLKLEEVTYVDSWGTHLTR